MVSKTLLSSILLASIAAAQSGNSFYYEISKRDDCTGTNGQTRCESLLKDATFKEISQRCDDNSICQNAGCIMFDGKAACCRYNTDTEPFPLKRCDSNKEAEETLEKMTEKSEGVAKAKKEDCQGEIGFGFTGYFTCCPKGYDGILRDDADGVSPQYCRKNPNAKVTTGSLTSGLGSSSSSSGSSSSTSSTAKSAGEKIVPVLGSVALVIVGVVKFLM